MHPRPLTTLLLPYHTVKCLIKFAEEMGRIVSTRAVGELRTDVESSESTGRL
jgi:hypothetical protein